MADYKTPGVYVEEISTLPPSVGQVPTAIPAFIGYTQKAVLNGKSIVNTPKHITSLLEYEMVFGRAADFGEIKVTLDAQNSVESVNFASKYYLYDSIRMFFANGGGECYVVSVGLHGDDVSMDALLGGVKTLEKEDHPTILACPDAMLLPKKDQAYSVQQAMLAQCNNLQDRVAVLDVYDGYKDRSDMEDVVLDYRNGIGVNFLKYGATYYPWVQTTLSHEFGFENIKLIDAEGTELNLEDIVSDPSAITNVKSAIADLKTINSFVSSPLGEDAGSIGDKFFKVDEGKIGTKDELVHYASVIKELLEKIVALHSTGLQNPIIENELRIKVNSSSAVAAIAKGLAALDKGAELGVVADTDFADYELATVEASTAFKGLEGADLAKKAGKSLKSMFESVVDILMSIKADTRSIKEGLDKNVYDTNALYKSIVNEVMKNSALLPTSGAIAGVYAQVDSDRGVWKAPANVSLASVVGPWVKLDNKQQEDLNVDVNAGKSINAVRAFTGKGTLVWGARTLAGNDNEWRYISVRRFFNMVEKSVKLSTNWAVFEPNDTNTWIRVKAMIENYLTNLWQQGALAGATPDAAFFVNIGLGSTMSQVDILEGRMNVEIGMAVVRPAEFIVLKFSHKLQES